MDPGTVLNWERPKAVIHARFYPNIIALLGFNPLPEARTPGERIRWARLTRGLSMKRLAVVAGVDEATVAKLEADVASPYVGSRMAVVQALDLNG